MASEPRFLIGFGERLTEPVAPPLGRGAAPPPYTSQQARYRLAPQIAEAAERALELPTEACPNGRVVSVVTLHPSFVAKSYFPGDLLRSAGFESIGSRPSYVIPELNSHQIGTRDEGRTFITRPGDRERPTTELFVESTRSNLRQWAAHLQDPEQNLSNTEEGLVVVESYRLPTVEERLRIPEDLPEEVALEVVLHAAGDPEYGYVLDAFEAYANDFEIVIELDRRWSSGGLCFVPSLAPRGKIEDLARFSFIRVVRTMPRLRLLEPPDVVTRAVHGLVASLPEGNPVDTEIRSAIFDGGVAIDSATSPWVTCRDAPGVGAPLSEYLEHGQMVTSALLFGSIDPDEALPLPFSHVDHFRVLDDGSSSDPFELYDVIRRIESILSQNDFNFINLSIGPHLPIEDDEVHSWTAFLDSHLADGQALATVAIGNNGRNDRQSGNARIQVPGDSVNALCVGAANSQSDNWGRAPYSALGPGRSPGVIKPDVIAFGGVAAEPFLTVSNDGSVASTAGTSFSAPATLRTAIGIRSLFGERLDPLALKALIIHTAERCDSHNPEEHGWGRVCPELEPIVICGDGVARVVYQGILTPSKYLRAQLPFPAERLEGNVRITATLAFATEVEPEQPSNYTRSGVEVFFRPDETRFATEESSTAKTSSFFRHRSFATEAELRADAHKWETVLHESIVKRGSSLNRPVFDIHYNARLGGHDGTSLAPKLRYAMVITVESRRTSDLYERVLRTYATQLEALIPRIGIPLRINS